MPAKFLYFDFRPPYPDGSQQIITIPPKNFNQLPPSIKYIKDQNLILFQIKITVFYTPFCNISSSIIRGISHWIQWGSLLSKYAQRNFAVVSLYGIGNTVYGWESNHIWICTRSAVYLDRSALQYERKWQMLPSLCTKSLHFTLKFQLKFQVGNFIYLSSVPTFSPLSL